MSEILRELDSIALFRNVVSAEPLRSLRAFLRKLEDGSSTEELINSYSAFVGKLYEADADADISSAIWKVLSNDMNPFLQNRIRQVVSPDTAKPLGSLIGLTAKRELELLTQIGSCTSGDIREKMYYDGYIPDFKSSNIDFAKRYMKMIDEIASNGYGMWTENIMFKVDGGRIVPVTDPDPIRVEDLFCYERQRNAVRENTKAFTDGRPAADVLLYGDAGTGKSSTVKAVAREYSGCGLRLIQMTKNDLDGLEYILERLSEQPMKFILFLDDISFEEGDDRISSVKSVLEGAASSHRKNVLIYATSNRRHMIRESVSSRGDEMHLSDTIAEQMSLSERFGLRVLFDKPGRADYLAIVKGILKSYGIRYDDEDIDLRAEQFATRAGGRSARCARQFCDRNKSETDC